MTIEYIARFVAPGAYALLPAELCSPAATALVLAIGLQESAFADRRQGTTINGPARGFWQFEQSGTSEVLTSHATREHAAVALRALCYVPLIYDARACHLALECQDTLAFVFARLLLWKLPDPLPRRGQAAIGWNQYLRAWRPGEPRRATWDAYYGTAWEHAAPVHDLQGHPSS